jgi:peptide/nickel transport system substrate-binding protein
MNDRRVSYSGLRRQAAIGMMCLAVLASAGCAGPRDESSRAQGGSLVISAFADADLLLPPLTMTGQGLQVVDAVFDRLVQPTVTPAGDATVAPSLARQWQWSADSLSIDFTLDARARWHDGVPVSASDVRFTFAAYTDSAVGSPYAQSLGNIDSVQVRAADRITVWFKRRSAQQFSDATTQMRILPAHLLDTVPRSTWKTSTFARRPVGSGRFKFSSWQAGARIEVVADSNNYRGRPGLDRVVWTITPDPAAATMRLFAGDADFLESVRPDAAAEFPKHPDVALLRSPSLVYGFLQFNLRRPNHDDAPHPVFGDRALRRTLSVAVDRELIVRAVFDSLARVALGPMTRIQVGADTSAAPFTYDTARARRTLDSLGWRAAGAGVPRARGGVPLRFVTLVPSSSSQRLRIATLLQEQFKAVGVQMEIENVEFNTLNARLAKGDFDAAMMAIGADPELGGIRGVWSTSAGRARGGTNFGSYANARFDALLDTADAQPNGSTARAIYARAHREILDDAPAIWIYEPWNLSGARKSIHTVGVRPDGWWMQLGDWTRDVTR